MYNCKEIYVNKANLQFKFIEIFVLFLNFLKVNKKINLMNFLNKILLTLFFFLCGNLYSQNNSQLAGQIADKTEEFANNTSLQIDKLDLKEPISLPKGIAKQVGGTMVIIGIDSLSFSKENAKFNAFTYIHLPGFEKKDGLAFAASGIQVHPDGFKSGQEIKLQLIQSPPIKFGNHAKLKLSDDYNNNYVVIDCNGFKSIKLTGEFIFDSTLISPADGNGGVVKVPFQVQSEGLNDLLIQASISPFKISKQDGVVVSAKDITIDLSDTRNASSFQMPSQYQNTYAGNEELWRGFFMKNVTVTVQKGFAKKNDSKPIEIQANNFLIDKFGVSGSFSATNVLDIGSGNTGGWPISIDKIGVTIVKNSLTGGEIGGLIKLPVSKKDTLRYNAIIKEQSWGWEYDVSVKTVSKMEFDALFADATIAPNSMIRISNIGNGEFVAEAILNGKLDLKHKLLNIKGVSFEKFRIVSKAPYVTDGLFSVDLEKEGSVNGFPLSLTMLQFSLNQSKPFLNIGLMVKLAGKGGNSLAGEAQGKILFDINNKFDQYGNVQSQSWDFDRVKLEKVVLDGNFSVVKVKGLIEIYEDDPVYGNGFRGMIDVSIGLDAIKQSMKADITFGKVEDYRYFRVYLELDVKFPLFPPITATRLKGGIYHHMASTYSDMIRQINNDPNLNLASMPPPKYVPNKDVLLGLQLGLDFEIGKKELISGGALFEIAFNSNGGIRNIILDGNINFVDSKQNSQVKFGGNILAIYDNPNKTFHAEIVPKLYVAGVIKGKGPDNALGIMVIHIDPNKWYVWAGRPKQRLGVTISVAGLDFLTFDSYFQFGSFIDEFPAPPGPVMEIFGNNPDLVIRDNYMTGKGNGFIFGSSVAVQLGGDFAIFYFKVQAGMGFDIMLRDYGSGARCEGSSGPIGINGWYATGQIYAYVRAAVGIKLGSKRLPIAKLGLAALLQARLPNPVWARGMLAGEYSILMGLVSGNFEIEFEVGEKCNIVGASALTEMPIIADLKPKSGSNDVDVFSMPQASFNLAIDNPFSLTDDDGSTRKFKIKLLEFKTTKDGQPVIGENKWNDKKDVITFVSSEILPPKSNLKTFVRVQWEEEKNGAWVSLNKENGSPDAQDSTVDFTTGEAPGNIPESNVEYSYPIKNQYHYYKNESANGYMKLIRGQSYLFTDPSDKPMTYKGFLKAKNKPTKEFNYGYDATNKRVNFSMPQDLENESVYNMELKKVPQSIRDINRNSTTTEENSNVGNSIVKVKNNTLSETLTKDVDISLYTSDFRTSKYNTFADKISNLGNFQSSFDITNLNLTILGGKYENAPETFDEFELKGKINSFSTLVSMEAIPNNNWYTNSIYPLIYQDYNNNGNLSITNRDISSYGNPPLKAIRVLTNNTPNGYKLSVQEALAGAALTKTGKILFAYDLSWLCFQDFSDLRNQAVNKFLKMGITNMPSGATKLITGQYTDMIRGSYNILLKYILPGSNNPSSSKTISINY